MTIEKPKKPPQKLVESTENIQNISFALLRLIGYILLIFSFIDYLAILIPLKLTNPAWEFQTIGRMVDHVWSILLGLTFIFLYSKGSMIKPREIAVLKFLSWLALPIGILYFLMLPLGINNTLTLYKNINNQFINQQGQQQVQVQKVNEALKIANSQQQLNNLARILKVPNANNSSQSTQELKDKLSQRIQKIAENSSATASAVKQGRINNIIKNSVRINLGTIISGVCLVVIWNMTRWIRIIDRNI